MDHKTLAARIRALLAKTTENGATEAEAVAAAEKARELLDKYQLDLGAIGMESEGTLRFDVNSKAALHFYINMRLGIRIAKFCDVKTWTSRVESRVTFFGLRSDVEFAHWLSESLRNFVLMQALDFELSTDVKANDMSFIEGILDRINARLREETERRAPQGIGNALVVTKSAIIDREFDKLGVTLHKRLTRAMGVCNESAYNAGYSAGDSASFGRPVQGARAALPSK